MIENERLIEQIVRNVIEKLVPSGYFGDNNQKSECSIPQGSMLSNITGCELISNRDLEILKNITSPVVCNAIESFKVRDDTDGYATSELKCMRPELKSMVGYAITVSVDSTTPASLEKRKFSEKFNEILDLILISPKPAVIVYKDLGPQRNKTCVTGDMVTSCFANVGAAGLVTDSCIRDLSGIKRKVQDFQVFATGSVVSHGSLNILEIGGTVNICGLIIKPGDLLHGDESGLVKIPLEFIKISQLISRCEEIKQIEQKYFDLLGEDKFNLEEARKFFQIH